MVVLLSWCSCTQNFFSDFCSVFVRVLFVSERKFSAAFCYIFASVLLSLQQRHKICLLICDSFLIPFRFFASVFVPFNNSHIATSNQDFLFPANRSLINRRFSAASCSRFELPSK